MTLRDGMTALVAELRTLTESGTVDYSLAGVTYWTDDQLQNCLDRFRNDVYFEELTSIPKPVVGSIEYYDYRSKYANWESGTNLLVTSSTGGTAGTAIYSFDAVRGIVTFTANQGGSIYYLSGRSYNLDASAADVWRKKAAHYSTAFNFSTDNHTINREQVYKHCMEKAEFYERGGNHTDSMLFERDDTL